MQRTHQQPTIAFLLPSLRRTGPIMFTQQLLEGLIDLRLGFAVEAVHCQDAGDLPFPCPTRTLKSVAASGRGRYDMVFSTMLRADLLLAWTASLLGVRRRVAVIHNFIDEDLQYLLPDQPLKAALFTALWRQALSRISEVVVSSPYMARRYREMVRPDLRCNVIPYGISDPWPLPERESGQFRPLAKPDEIRLLVCGNLIARKNFGLVIQALSRLPGHQVTIVGDGPKRRALQDLAVSHGVQDRVHFAGEDFGLQRHMAQADIFVLSSLSEGYGLALLQALGSGLPTACADLPIYRELMPLHDVPRFDPQSVESLVGALQRLGQDLPGYGARARQVFERHHRREAMAKAYQAIIERRLTEHE